MSRGKVATPHQPRDIILTRMNQAMMFGQVEREADWFPRLRRATVGGRRHLVQKWTWQGVMVILFVRLDDWHKRRFLVDEGDKVWMDNARNEAVLISDSNKYYAVVRRVMPTQEDKSND